MSLAVNEEQVTWVSMGERRADSDDIALQDQKSKNINTALPPAVPAPPYRHAAPSGPWPWMDFRNTSVSTLMNNIDKSWRGYPQNLFGNWTPDQVEHSGMLIKCSKNQSSTIYWMDVGTDGKFATPDMTREGCASMATTTTQDVCEDGHISTATITTQDVCEDGHISTVTTTNQDEFWDFMQGERPGNIRVRSLFVDDLTSPVLRMLGTRYNIEPFYFTSSINWIPSRYQEASNHGKGDHITITLPFVRTLHSSSPLSSPAPVASQFAYQRSPQPSCAPREDAQINTQAPFPLRDGNMLFIDLLAIHMVRDVEASTIISYHPESTWCQTSAKRLHSLTRLIGGSVYWQNIFSKTEDPTFLFLTILWYALYAWDESFEFLYNHVNKLESDVQHDSRIELTRELHVLQAHLLHYQSLLHDFRVSVSFIETTPNPAMESKAFTDEQRTTSAELMKQESENLLSEIDRLEKRREMLSSRLKNAMDLAIATVKIEDSRQTLMLTEATVRDSAAMKRISYVTTFFLPANLTISFFSLQPGTIVAHYVEITILLTLFIVYTFITLHTHSSFHSPDSPLRIRAAWPVIFLWMVIHEKLHPQPNEKMADEKV